MAFNKCCDKRIPYDYIILHDKVFDKDTNDLFMRFIEYFPETPSYQAEHDTIFSNNLYDHFLLDLFKQKYHIFDEDILICTGNPPIINRSIGKYYENEICLNCSKVALHLRANETFIHGFISHLRNIIAHGSFNIIANYFIGFDHLKFKGIEYTAVIKMPYEDIKSFIKDSMNVVTVLDIFIFYLEKLGYTVHRHKDNSIYVVQNKKTYYMEIRNYKGRYASSEDIADFVNNYNHIEKSNCMFILIIDSTYATKDSRMELGKMNVYIIDKAAIKSMIDGEDVLRFLEQMHNLYKVNNA